MQTRTECHDMKILLIVSLGLSILLLVFPAALRAQLTGGNAVKISKPVVIELFTSQSCSSCPAADALLKDISGNSNVIPLAFHVTYWNHLDWQDTLSREFSTARQHAYATQRASRRVYTPQMIVNGLFEFNGSDRAALSHAIKNAPDIDIVPLSRDGGTINMALPNMAHKSKNLSLYVYGTRQSHIQDIAAGENHGRTITYTHPVVYEKSLGAWDGKAKNLSVPIPPLLSLDHMVVLIQQTTNGPIMAAGRIALGGS